MKDDRLKAGEPDDQTTLSAELTCRLGELRILHPSGTFALTPASLISIQAIARHQERLEGIGIDWGTGTGCLAVAAAKIATVHTVVGLEVSRSNVAIAAENAARNGVAGKVAFLLSDSFSPFAADDRELLESLAGRASFILANPPSSEGDDGFGFRRIVLAGARRYLAQNGVVFLSVSYQYSQRRVERLCQEVPGYVYSGVLADTGWVPFDLSRPDLLHCLNLYADEELRGGLEYTFKSPAGDAYMNAQAALSDYEETGRSPLSKWQTLLFELTRTRMPQEP